MPSPLLSFLVPSLDWLPVLLLCLLPPLLLLHRHLTTPPTTTTTTTTAPPRPNSALVISQTPANHSPRALSHAKSLAATPHIHTVYFIAYPPTPPSLPPNILHIPIPTKQKHHPNNNNKRTPRTLLSNLLHASLSLHSALRHVSRLLKPHHHSPASKCTHIILNTPPALPTLPLLLLLRPFLFPHARLTLDWHNLAYTLMQSTASPTPLVSLAKFIELAAARFVTNHWTVSHAMADVVERYIARTPTVVYDRPTFHIVDPKPHVQTVRHNARNYATVIPNNNNNQNNIHNIPFLITSTSWTPDEDFTLLLSALQILDTRKRSLIIAITGKGPLRSHFEHAVQQASFNYITVWFAWLPIHEYPHLLAASDLGLSLHASSSGLDLPMKAVDMLGAGLPVLALSYPCIGELVVQDRTGFLFQSDQQLADLVERLLFLEDGIKERQRVAHNVRQIFEKQEMRWDYSWQRCALPTLDMSDTVERVNAS